MPDAELKVTEQEGSRQFPPPVGEQLPQQSLLCKGRREPRVVTGTGILCDIKAWEPFPDSTRSPAVQVCRDTWWPEAPLQHLPPACPISS